MKKIRVKVKPNARVNELEQLADGSWVARVKAPPTAGQANSELCRLIAVRFGVSKSRVRIRSGRSSRTKLVEIDA